MTVAVKLRCGCRRTLATLEHGSDRFVTSERERLGVELAARAWDRTVEPQQPRTVADEGTFAVADLDVALIMCSACHTRRSFAAAELPGALRRARSTGKAVEIIAVDD